MLINHNQNMLCLDEFDILELRENADECDYLFVVSPKIETKICSIHTPPHDRVYTYPL